MIASRLGAVHHLSVDLTAAPAVLYDSCGWTKTSGGLTNDPHHAWAD